MHQTIRDSLESYLKGSPLEIPPASHAHLAECRECSSELRLLEAQSELLRSLRSSHEVEPRAGFYARVLERIQAQQPSIWSVFLDRKFGFRLALASAALVTILGTYLVTSEPTGSEQTSATAVVAGTAPQAMEQQRDAVLLDLASYHQ